jgi:adenylosuccinate synthase
MNAFVTECARRDAALPDPFAEYGRKGGRPRRVRT